MNVLLIISRMLTPCYVYRASGSAEGALEQALISATNVETTKFTLYVKQYSKKYII